MMTDWLNFLQGTDVVNAVESAINAIAEQGGVVTPAVVRAVRCAPHVPSAELGSAVLELALGTLRARKLGKALPGWLYTERMAEQCTHPTIATYHGKAFANCERVIEICTGAGHDAAAIARVASAVSTYESDEVVAAIARGNLVRAGITNAEIFTEAWSAKNAFEADGYWADPSRRTLTGRQRSGALYEPPLHSIPTGGVVGIKVGPGDAVNHSNFCSEFIGFGKECRERILWRGNTEESVRVTLVDKGVQWHPQHGAQPLVVPQANYVIEPHNALIASGAVGAFFAEIGAAVFDPHIAYGALNTEPPASPWYSVYRVRKIDAGVSVRRIQQSIREFGWGATTIFKKRGWPNNPEELRRSLHFSEDGPAGVVMIMRVGGAHQTVYATSAESL